MIVFETSPPTDSRTALAPIKSGTLPSSLEKDAKAGTGEESRAFEMAMPPVDTRVDPAKIVKLLSAEKVETGDTPETVSVREVLSEIKRV